MIIKESGIQITIADDSPKGLKIQKGYDFEVVSGKIKIGKMYTEPTNKWQFIKELEKVKSLLVKILNHWE